MSRTLALLVGLVIGARVSADDALPNTKPLTREGDLAAQMVAGIDKFLLAETAAAVEKRRRSWKPDYSSAKSFSESVQPQRDRLRALIGAVDPRLPPHLEYVGFETPSALVGKSEAFDVFSVRWRVLPGVDAEGLLLEPKAGVTANVVAVPDADWTPEQFAGLAPGLSKEVQYAARLAEMGCRVLVPTVIDRKDTHSGNPRIRFTNQPHREFVYRQAFEMGRHIIGYEVQKVLAAVDWFTRGENPRPVGILGVGEGGLLALYAGAIDTRITATVVGGYFGPREGLWQEPIYRNVWGLLREFGDAEIADLILPRGLIVLDTSAPEVAGPPPARDGRGGAAPGMIQVPTLRAAGLELARSPTAERLKLTGTRMPGVVRSPAAGAEAAEKFYTVLAGVLRFSPDARPAKPTEVTPVGTPPDAAARQRRQFEQLVAFTQKLWRDSDETRRKFWAKANPASLETWAKTTESYRRYFAEEVIGQLPAPTLPANPRTRQAYDEPKWLGYEVTLDLYPDVFAFGILLLPKDIKPGEKRPVVVCQHGLEGRPTDVVNPQERTRFYHSFGAQLADRGYIVFAPQNPYIGRDAFRTLQRKANPLKLSLFSFITRQHERILDWLATLPEVDADRIALYGLSYGGKTAMRVPALLPRYALSICSGDFNEWIGKNVSTEYRGSYMFTGEYEMFEFNLGNTFNYAEMAFLIAPRPFMVERGHDDGVGIDEMVAAEYAKVRYLYANKLKIPEQTRIEFFVGGHEIHGQGTFAFLQRHLGYPKK